MSCIPYECQPQSGLKVNGGESKVFTIAFPSRAYLSKIICTQYDGVTDNFLLEIFNNKSVINNTPMSDSAGPDKGPIDERHYWVGKPLQGINGELIHFSEDATGGHGYAFFSQDKNPPGAELGNPRRLYVRISPAGTGEKTYTLTIGGEQVVG